MKNISALFVVVLFALASCGRGRTDALLDKAETLLIYNPDSALVLLSQSDARHGNAEQRASWCLLNVWAGYNAYRLNLIRQVNISLAGTTICARLRLITCARLYAKNFRMVIIWNGWTT